MRYIKLLEAFEERKSIRLHLMPSKSPMKLHYYYDDKSGIAFSDNVNDPVYLILQGSGAGHYYDELYLVPLKLRSLALREFPTSDMNDDMTSNIESFIEVNGLDMFLDIDHDISNSYSREDQYTNWCNAGGPYYEYADGEIGLDWSFFPDIEDEEDEE